MASSTDSSTALQEVDLKVGSGLSTNLQASSAAAATGRTVDGISDTTATVTQAVVALNSTIDVGAQATVQVVQAATTKADAVSVGGASSTAVATFDSGTGSGVPAGAFGGLIDTAATAKDLSIGSAGQIVVSVDDSAAATATNTAGNATASAIAPGIDGLYAITAEVGTTGALQAQVAADFAATATTVGTSLTAGVADATATAVRIAAITADATPTADPSTISFGAGGSIKAVSGVAADPISLAATATSVAAPATSTTTAGTVAGITDQLTNKGVIDSGAALSLEATGATTQVSKATTVEGDATANSGVGTSTKGDVLFGVQIGTLTVGTDSTMVVAATGNLSAAAATTAGDASAAATLPRVMGANIDTLDVGSSTNVQALADLSLDAKATSTAGTATASSQIPDSNVSGGVAAFQVTKMLDVGTAAQINGIGNLKGAATATSVAGAADAKAGTGQADSHGVVFINTAPTDDFGIGGDAKITGVAATALTATAQAVGSVAADADAKAQAGGLNVIGVNPNVITIGIDFPANSVSLSQSAVMVGSGDLKLSSLGQTVTGDSEAATLSDYTVGLRSNTNNSFSVGKAADLNVTAAQQTSARAITVDGTSTAVQGSSVLAGLFQDTSGGSSPLAVGTDISLNAQASGTSLAVATSIDAGANGSASATVNNDGVYGTNLGGSQINIGASALLRSTATSIQSAQASNIGPAGTPNNGAVTADVAGDDAIAGVRASALTVGTNLLGYTAKASFDGQASSSNVAATGDSKANVGVTNGGLQVYGIRDSDIMVGGTAAGSVGIDSQSTAAMQATSRAVAGAALANVGASDALVVGIGSNGGTKISIGTQLPLLSQAQATVTSDAASVQGGATANSNLTSIGLQQTTFEVGTVGQVRSIAGLANTLTARSVLGSSSIAGSSTVQAVDTSNLTFGSSANLTFTSSGQGRVGGESVTGTV